MCPPRRTSPKPQPPCKREQSRQPSQYALPKPLKRILKQACSLAPFDALSRLPPPTPHLSLVDTRAPPPASLTTPPRRSFRQRIELSYTALLPANRTVRESTMAENLDFKWNGWNDFLNDDAANAFGAQADELGMQGNSGG